MINLQLSATLLASFTVVLGAGQAGAQALDPSQAPASPVPGEVPVEPGQETAPQAITPAAEPGSHAAGAISESAGSSDIEVQVAAEMAALQSQSASSACAGERSERRLDLYGFADFSYMRLMESSAVLSAANSSFGVGNLNLYLASELGDEWRSLVEVRFMYLPNGGQPTSNALGPAMNTTVLDNADFSRPVQWGGIHIERAWLERTFHKLLTVRVGHWLTPYGIWNVDHGSPVVIGVGRPFIVGEALFPASQTGIEIYGTADIDRFQLGYHLTLSNGRGPSSTTLDLDDNKAIGGRLFLRHESTLGTVSVGTAVYRGRYTDKYLDFGTDPTGAPAVVGVIQSQYDEFSLSADLKWQWGGLLVQGEVIENEVAYVPSGRTVSTSPGAPAFDSDYRRWGVYGLAGYRFTFLGAMPYAGGGYYKEGSPSWIPKLWDLWLGLNLRPTPRVVLKVQYTNVHFYLDPATPDARMLMAQTAWSF
jgi:hypothetical protein